MAFIVEQFVGDRGIQLGAEDVIRPFSFGTNWSKLRLGVRWAANGYAKIPDGVLPGIGVCTGNNAMYSGVCTDAVLLPCWTVGAASTYIGTAPSNFYTQAGSNAPLIQQRTGSTTVTGSGGFSSTTGSSISANPTLLRGGFFWDITKGTIGAAGITTGGAYISAAQAVVDMSRGTFLANMENEAGCTGSTFVAGGAGTLPTRFVKDWDSMFVHWIRAVPTLCVYDMTVVRFA
jgi:hypothetical protein